METEKLIYTFHKKFSRFEYALKQAGYVRVSKGNDAAQVDWKTYENNTEYEMDADEQEFLKNAPQREIFKSGALSWEDLKFGKTASDIKKLVLVLKTVRNNLFHGAQGSHGGWADEAKGRFLLEKAIHCLDKLSNSNTELKKYFED